MRTSSVFWRNFDGETVLFVDKPQPVSSGKRYTMNQFNSASGDRSNCLRSAHSEVWNAASIIWSYSVCERLRLLVKSVAEEYSFYNFQFECFEGTHSVAVCFQAVFLIHVLFRILRLKRSQFFCTVTNQLATFSSTSFIYLTIE